MMDERGVLFKPDRVGAPADEHLEACLLRRRVFAVLVHDGGFVRMLKEEVDAGLSMTGEAIELSAKLLAGTFQVALVEVRESRGLSKGGDAIGIVVVVAAVGDGRAGTCESRIGSRLCGAGGDRGAVGNPVEFVGVSEGGVLAVLDTGAGGIVTEGEISNADDGAGGLNGV